MPCNIVVIRHFSYCGTVRFNTMKLEQIRQEYLRLVEAENFTDCKDVAKWKVSLRKKEP